MSEPYYICEWNTIQQKKWTIDVFSNMDISQNDHAERKRIYMSVCIVCCTPKPNLPVNPGVSWLPTFIFQSPVIKRTSILVLEGLVGLDRTVQLQLLQFVTGWGIAWITVILNDLPWKQTEIILSFWGLHLSTTFWTLWLTMMATPFLLRDSCPQ